MEKRKLEVTKRPSYITSADGHKIFLREVEEERPRRINGEWVLINLLCVAGWVLFFVSINIK
jgi:hypothetical protein